MNRFHNYDSLINAVERYRWYLLNEETKELFLTKGPKIEKGLVKIEYRNDLSFYTYDAEDSEIVSIYFKNRKKRYYPIGEVLTINHDKKFLIFKPYNQRIISNLTKIAIRPKDYLNEFLFFIKNHTDFDKFNKFIKLYKKQTPVKSTVPERFGKNISSQTKTLIRYRKNPITLIWGPPGTGKSHNIGYIVSALLLDGFDKKIVALSNTNVAVDILTKKIYNAMKNAKIDINKHKILRFGFPILEELRREQPLLAYKKAHDRYMRKFRKLQRQLFLFTVTEGKDVDIEKAKIENEIKMLKEEYTHQLKKFVDESKIITLTFNAFLNRVGKYIDTKDVGCIIVDEASIVPIAYYYIVSQIELNHLIIAGDPEQLKPIFKGKEETCEEYWFSHNIFDLFNIKAVNGETVHFLREQRRMPPDVCKSISRVFYSGNLITAKDKKPTKELWPEKADIIRVDYSDVQIPAELVFKNVRNKRSCYASLLLLKYIKKLYKNPDLSYLIVTPYKNQRKNLNMLVVSNFIKGSLKIDVLTIHRCQGTGSDIVIFDPAQVWNKFLYLNPFLINVAASRAKKKLFVLASDDDLGRNRVLNELLKDAMVIRFPLE